MIKEFIGITAGLTVAMLFLGQATNPAQSAEPDYSNISANLRMLTGNPRGSWPPTCAKIAELVSKKMPKVAISCSTGASFSNVEALNAGRADLALTLTDALYKTYHGKEKYEGNPQKNVRFLSSLQPIVVHVISPQNGEVNTLEDIAKKPLRITAFTRRSATYALNQDVFELYGSSLEDLKERGGTVSTVAYGEGFRLMQDGQVDFLVFTTGLPAAPVIEAESKIELQWHQLDDKRLEQLVVRNPGMSTMKLPASTYESVKDDYETVGSFTALIGRDDLDPDLVQGIVSALWDNVEEFRKIGAFAKPVVLENAIAGSTVPVHEGAKRYYDAKGVSAH